MERDGPKKFGRLLKKNGKTISLVSLTNFSFSEIAEAEITYPDNPSGSIIHTRLHDEAELKRVIGKPEKFFDPLLDDSQRPPVMQPKDFTAEWLRDKKRWKKRRDDGDLEEDDDLEAEVAGLKGFDAKSEQDKATGPLTEVQTAAAKLQEPPSEVQRAGASQTPPPPLSVPLGKSVEAGKPMDDSMKLVGKAIKDLAHQEIQIKKSVQPEIGKAPVSIERAETKDSFIPLDTKNEQGFSKEEAAAMEKYQKRQSEHAIEQKLSEKQIQAEIEKAKADGYQEGLRRGEEKASKESGEYLQSIGSKLGGVVKELSNLKQEVLNNIQQNFYEIAQAVTEALLQRELSVDPNALATVIRKAVSDTVGNNEFKVKVHSETYAKLSTLEISDLKDVLVKDDSVVKDNFKVESKLGTVDGNIKDLIAGLLNQMPVDLFGDEKKAG